MKRLCVIAALTIALTSCGGGDSTEFSGDINKSAPSTAPQPARLVVAIVYDQFPSWAYARYRDLLSPEGALQRTRARGADHVVEYNYATTHTAPGHTAIFTGVPPARNGVGSNQMWTSARGMRSIVDDGEYAVHGLPDAFASPGIIKVDSVADAVRKTHGDQAKIVGLSLKDRGAVLTTGRDPDLALWYEKRIGRITSSSYYSETLPEWVTAWIEQNPIQNYFEDWEPADHSLLQQLLGPDDAPGEADYLGFGTTFPHNPAGTLDPNRTFRLTPGSTDHLLDLARVAVERLGMGDDDIPDLLVLSISSIDYSGHVFGPDSWEYVDNLIRSDAAVGRFLTELETTTSLAVLITSDHGGAHLPELSEHFSPDSGRVYPDILPEQMNEALAPVLGEGAWVAAYEPPFVFLSPEALVPDRRDKVVNALIDALEVLPEVHSAYDVRTAADWSTDPDALKRSVALAIPDPDLGAVLLVRNPGSIDDESFERGKGTGHGSPWPYDCQVPVLFSGPGVANAHSTEPLAQNRVAATLCKLLGVTPPSQISSVQPLPGL